MQGTRAVQVVLGEGEPGILRLVLEAQGFDVVGHARGDDELREVIGLTRPSVIVLDAGISALAAVDAQTRSDGAPIVVVWPKDAFTPVAEERVDPASAFLELGNAVRRVVERHAAPIRIPEADDRRGSERLADPGPSSPARGPRFGRARHALVLAAAWTIALTALAAIGLAVPSALRSFEPARAIHPFLERPDRALTPDREGSGGPPADVGSDPACARPDDPRTGTHPHGGAPDAPGRGCGQGRGDGSSGVPGHGHGRPADAGKGSAGHRSGGGSRHHAGENAGGDGDQGRHDDEGGDGQGRDDRGDGGGDGPGDGGHGEDGGHGGSKTDGQGNG